MSYSLEHVRNAFLAAFRDRGEVYFMPLDEDNAELWLEFLEHLDPEEHARVRAGLRLRLEAEWAAQRVGREQGLVQRRIA